MVQVQKPQVINECRLASVYAVIAYFIVCYKEKMNRWILCCLLSLALCPIGICQLLPEESGNDLPQHSMITIAIICRIKANIVQCDHQCL